MCGMNWYREQMERAEGDMLRLSELAKMLEARYKLSPTQQDEREPVNPEIIAIYREIELRKNDLAANSARPF